MNMNHKAQTTLNFVMTIGIIFIVGSIIIVMKQFLFTQANVAEADTAEHLLNQITLATKKAMSYPSDAKYIIKVPYTEKYTLNITSEKFIMSFPQRNIVIEKEFTAQNIELIPSTVKDSGLIYVYRQANKIYITKEDIDDLDRYMAEKAKEGEAIKLQ